MSQIWVDADACPQVVKDILIRACERTLVPVTFVANQAIRLPQGLPMKAVQVAHGFDVAVVVVIDPEGAALGRVLAHEIKARDLRVVGVLIRSAQFLEQHERTGSLVGGADVEQA